MSRLIWSYCGESARSPGRHGIPSRRDMAVGLADYTRATHVVDNLDLVALAELPPLLKALWRCAVVPARVLGDRLGQGL